jgi:hypothetical protein
MHLTAYSQTDLQNTPHMDYLCSRIYSKKYNFGFSFFFCNNNIYMIQQTVFILNFYCKLQSFFEEMI